MKTNIFARLRLLGPALALAAVIALTGLLAKSDTAFAQPTFDPCGLLAVSDSSPGANSDIVSTFGVGIGSDCQAIPTDPSDPPDLQYGATVNFTPPQWGIYRDADMPDGAHVATLSSIAMLGLIGGACSNRLFPEFEMLDATTDMSKQVGFNDPEEEFDPPDTNDTQGNEPDDQFDLGSDGLPLGVTRYPDYLTRILEGEGGAGDTLQPITRLYGQTKVADIDVSLNFVIFEPGTVFRTRAGEIRRTDPRLGYPSVTVLQATGDPDTEADIEDNNSVSDFCSPLQADTTLFGVSKDNPATSANEGGIKVRKNPSDGTYNFVTYAVSQRDADDDGIENMLDPCPFAANPNWDPRIQPGSPASPNLDYHGDDDRDGLPNECDPEPNTASHHDPGGVYDEDFDRYGNRGDNCPLVPNSLGQQVGIGTDTGTDNQEDADLDQIGDACDPHPNTPDGTRFEVCLVSQVKVGAGGPEPDPAPQNMQPCDPEAEIPAGAFDILDGDDNGGGDDGGGDNGGGDNGGGNNGGGDNTGATPTAVAGQYTNDNNADGGTTTGTDDIGGGLGTGVGSLAPVASSIPAWATIISGLGGAGLLGSLGALAARIFGIRLPGRRDD